MTDANIFAYFKCVKVVLLVDGYHCQHEVQLFLGRGVRQIASSWKATAEGLGFFVII